MSTEFCRHIRTTGRRCGCPALGGLPYCYFHDRSRRRHHQRAAEPEPASPLILHPMRADSRGQAEPMYAEPIAQPAPPLVLDFPALEDRESIQVAASMIVAALGRNQLDPKRAATMLYGLQVAVAVTRHDVHPDDNYIVETEAIPTGDGADLSPDEDPESLPQAAA